jgi:hypothetical protein
MIQENKFNFKSYFNTLMSLLSSPGSFFSGIQGHVDVKQALGFLLVSSVFYTCASLVTEFPSNPAIRGGVHLLNCIGMVFIFSASAYLMMRLIIGKPIRFTELFAVYALASGLTLISSWIPVFTVLTEPWRCWVVWVGMTKGFGFKKNHAAVIVIVSHILVIIFFRSLMPLIDLYKG